MSNDRSNINNRKKHNVKNVLVFQSFPEAVFYNRETRVFELRSDAKRRLAREVKIAVRLGKKRNGELYRAVHNNSFSPFPLLPIGETSQEVKHLSAVYTVQVLYINRDMNFLTFRLPKFLLLLF